MKQSNVTMLWIIGVVLIACLPVLAGCVAQRTVGWERTVVEVEGDAAQVIGEANEHWNQRQDITHLQKAIELYEQAVQIDQENLDIFITLARATYFLADAYLEDDKERQIEMFDKGLAYAEKGMALDPEFKRLVDSGKKVEDAINVLDERYVGAIYWGSANLGKWGLRKGLATILANKERGKKMMERCLELDDTYFYGGPHRWFGGYYAKLPSIAGRDLDKSKAHFEQSLLIAPDYFGTRILRAEHYSLNAQDKELYRSDLEYVLNTPANVMPDVLPEQEVEKKRAADMLDDIEDRFL